MNTHIHWRTYSGDKSSESCSEMKAMEFRTSLGAARQGELSEVEEAGESFPRSLSLSTYFTHSKLMGPLIIVCHRPNLQNPQKHSLPPSSGSHRGCSSPSYLHTYCCGFRTWGREQRSQNLTELTVKWLVFLPGFLLVAELVVDWLPLTCQSALHDFIRAHVEAWGSLSPGTDVWFSADCHRYQT